MIFTPHAGHASLQSVVDLTPFFVSSSVMLAVFGPWTASLDCALWAWHGGQTNVWAVKPSSGGRAMQQLPHDPRMT